MCGIAGIVRCDGAPLDEDVLARMAGVLRHRGPDGSGVRIRDGVGFAHVRLSIVDIEGGAQPLTNEDGRVSIVYNGEIYNHVELRAELESLGHRFRSRSDTEVLVHGYEQWGAELLPRLNGQFAFAIHDERRRVVFLARDRFGVRPLFIHRADGLLVFGSEVKAIFASGEVDAAPDYRGLDQVFTFWGARAPTTVFANVQSLAPGHCALWRDGRLETNRWFSPEYREADRLSADAVDQLDALLNDSVSMRLRADVPVGAYLSGGLDSSVTASLASQRSGYPLHTFSITFDDPKLNEAQFQKEMAEALGSVQHWKAISAADIAGAFPEVIRHCETPILRTAPAPMFLLAKLTQESGIKVVLTGEGSDELFLGYDLFKEAAFRRASAVPGSTPRSRLFERLYPGMAQQGKGEFWSRWFTSAGDPGDPLFSHLPRFLLTSRIKEFYSADLKAHLAACDPLAELRDDLPRTFAAWSPANQAAYLELVTLLEPYLLSSQGDRMSLAHGVEARYPFLDHALFEWTARLPVRSKLRGMADKRILRRWAGRILPPGIAARAKQAYRAPESQAFFGGAADYVDELLGPQALSRFGLFDARAVAALLQRARAGRTTSTRENQAFVGILSAQLWHQSFFASGSSLSRPQSPKRVHELI